MRTKSRITAGAMTLNHNHAIVGQSRGLRVRTSLKAGGLSTSPSRNHNQTAVRHFSGLRVKTSLKAGGLGTSPSRP